MAKQIITGDESYYPAVWDSAHNGTIMSDGGITIRQKFIADFMTRNISESPESAQKAFESYLKIINQEDK